MRIAGLSSPSKDPVAVDLFTLAGEFLGTVSIPRPLLHVSGEYLYLVESNAQDDLLLCRYRYWIGVR